MADHRTDAARAVPVDQFGAAVLADVVERMQAVLGMHDDHGLAGELDHRSRPNRGDVMCAGDGDPLAEQDALGRDEAGIFQSGELPLNSARTGAGQPDHLVGVEAAIGVSEEDGQHPPLHLREQGIGQTPS